VSDFHDLRDRRLWNFGRWARQGNPQTGYALQCYQFLCGDDDANDGWGEYVEGNTVLAPQLDAARAEYEVDIEDAEILNAWISQLASVHKSALVRRYVHRARGWSRTDVDAAIHAILGLMSANRAVIERMRNG
jgi:hypothetical protein